MSKRAPTDPPGLRRAAQEIADTPPGKPLPYYGDDTVKALARLVLDLERRVAALEARPR